MPSPRNPRLNPLLRGVARSAGVCCPYPPPIPAPRPLALFLLVAPAARRVNRPMPLYAYAPLTAPCRLCGTGFEHRQVADAPDLSACPTCGQPVRRAAVHPVNSPQLSAPLSVSRAKQAGFTILQRTAGGEFEKK